LNIQVSCFTQERNAKMLSPNSITVVEPHLNILKKPETMQKRLSNLTFQLKICQNHLLNLCTMQSGDLCGKLDNVPKELLMTSHK